LGTAAAKEHDKHKIGLFSGVSTAMTEAAQAKRVSSLQAAAKAVDALNQVPKSG
jgi:hypothetical protein